MASSISAAKTDNCGTDNIGTGRSMGQGLVAEEEIDKVLKQDVGDAVTATAGTAATAAVASGSVTVSSSVNSGCSPGSGAIDLEGSSSRHGLSIVREEGHFNDTEITALSGALAGFLAGVIVCPLDVAKTRLQAQGLQLNGPVTRPVGSVATTFAGKYYSGIWGTLTTIVRDESIRGLYKGIVPIVLGYFPTWMIYFSVYERCKLSYPRYFNNSEFLSHSMSALTAGAISTTLTNPIWVVKTRLMLQSGKNIKGMTHYKNTLDAFVKIYKVEGIKSFYSGLIPSLFGLLHVAIHFPVYEKLKKVLHCYPSGRPNQDTMNINGNSNPQTTGSTNFQLGRLIVASCGSKMIASTLTYPHEILRTRLQLKSDMKPSIKSIIRTTYAKEGIRGFYSGFLTNMFRTVPASAITLVSFEYFRKHFKLWNDSIEVEGGG
ncbi:Yia6/Yea6 [Kluyveromyces lactis]|nr:Yia6/Yea6 [Kluyveromyces lactis]